MVTIKDISPEVDAMEALENMQNYCFEKIQARSWYDHLEHPPGSLSGWVAQALNETPLSGAILMDRIEEARAQLATTPKQKQAFIIEQLWHEIHSELQE